jgi:hypothetical protein
MGKVADMRELFASGFKWIFLPHKIIEKYVNNIRHFNISFRDFPNILLSIS